MSDGSAGCDLGCTCCTPMSTSGDHQNYPESVLASNRRLSRIRDTRPTTGWPMLIAAVWPPVLDLVDDTLAPSGSRVLASRSRHAWHRTFQDHVRKISATDNQKRTLREAGPVVMRIHRHGHRKLTPSLAIRQCGISQSADTRRLSTFSQRRF